MCIRDRAYGLDRNELIDTVLSGQGLVFEGPFLPGTWAARPDLMTAYTFQPETAAALLDTAGWTFGDGVRFREGAPLSVRLVALDQPEQRAVAEAVAQQWAALGVDAQLTLLPDLPALNAALTERNFDAVLLDIAPPADPDLYDFWSQEAIVRGHNYSGWNNRRASEALEAARQLLPVGERTVYYEAFLENIQNSLEPELKKIGLVLINVNITDITDESGYIEAVSYTHLDVYKRQGKSASNWRRNAS